MKYLLIFAPLFAGCAAAAASAPSPKQSLTRSEVALAVKQQLPVLERCLAAHPSDGMSFDDVIVTYAIAPDGSVDDVAIESDATHEAFSCMVEALSAYKFDRTLEGISEVKLSVPIASAQP